MSKFLSGAVLSAVMFSVNMAPVLANATNIKTSDGVTVNSVVPKSNLVEIEGRTLTDAESAKVEGEALFIPIAIGAVKLGKAVGFGVATGVAFNTGANAVQGKPLQQGLNGSVVGGSAKGVCAFAGGGALPCFAVGFGVKQVVNNQSPSFRRGGGRW